MLKGDNCRIGQATVRTTIVMFSLFGVGHQAIADSGFYLGGSVGDATIQATITEDTAGDIFAFDESDFAWKVFGGYTFDFAVFDLGIEGGYVDLGGSTFPFPGPSIGLNLDLDLSAWDVFGLIGVELGPIGVFAKAGVVSWDVDISPGDTGISGDSGSDPAYGIGARFSVRSFEVRLEYEAFDIEGADDVYMLSAGLVWTF